MNYDEAVTVKSLLDAVDEDQVLAALNALYDENATESYRSALRTLKAMKPEPSTTDCVLEKRWSLDEPPEPYVDVSGAEMGDPKTRYAIEFRPWPEWLGMIVTSEPELELTPTDTLAHILYEITWGGWTPDECEEKLDEIVSIAEDVRQMLDAEEDT